MSDRMHEDSLADFESRASSEPLIPLDIKMDDGRIAEMSWHAAMVYSVLLTGSRIHSIDSVQLVLRWSWQAVQNAFGELDKHGYVERRHVNRKTDQSSTTIAIVTDKLPPEVWLDAGILKDSGKAFRYMLRTDYNIYMRIRKERRDRRYKAGKSPKQREIEAARKRVLKRRSKR